jgi:Rrf2 family protein
MKLSTESRYAVLALMVLAREPNGTVIEAGAVAERADVPAAFLAKIFSKLTRHGILTSHRGRVRGYALARPSNELTLKTILEAIDGPDLFERCVFWTDTCDANDPCPLHPAWQHLRPKITEAMASTTLDQVTVESVSTSGRSG